MGQARPGEIYSFRILGGGYGAAQVIAARPDRSRPTVQLLPVDIDGYDIYGFGAEDFPGLTDCPYLSAVAIHGLRASDAKILRRRLADVDRLELTKARSDRWLADNIDNPFRDWDADNLAFGKAAMKLWKSALQEARKLDGAPSREQASAVVLVDGLNRLDGRHGATIDTLRREQALRRLRPLVEVLQPRPRGARDACC